MFDTVVNDQSPDINYNPMTGVFTLNRPGNYFISWWVATDGASRSTILQFSVELGAANYAQGSTPVVTGQVSGSALVTVAAEPVTLILKSTTSDVVALASTTVQANIVILQVM